MATSALVAPVRRLIALVTIVGCCACTPGQASLPHTRESPGKVSNRAAIMPGDGGSVSLLTATPTTQSGVTPTPEDVQGAWDPTMLTHGGCCPEAFWSADSREVRFLARPEPTQPASIYGVPRTGGPAKLVRREPAYYSADGRYTLTVAGENVVIERATDGERWSVSTDGRGVTFSHSTERVAWTESSDAYTNLNLIQRTVWMHDLETGQSSKVITVVGGRLLGWTPDDAGLVVSGGLVTGGPRGIWRVGVTGESPELLFQADEIQGALMSPDGKRLAFFVAFGTDAERNGVWALATEAGSATRLRLFGSYRWRDDDRLLIIPLVIDPEGDALWQFNASDGSITLLLHPGEIPFKVANNDWSVSPDGESLAFRSSNDLNLWTLRLPSE